MIRIIHGDNLVFSRNFFLDKKNKENGVLFAGKEVFLMDIIQAFEGKSLFFETKNIFIEDFFSKRKPDDEYKKIIDYLKNNEEKISVTFWEGKDIGKTRISIFKNPKVRSFRLPESLFKFLDSLRPNNSLKLIELLHASLRTSEPEFLLYMLIRQIRLLLCLAEKENPNESIDEIKRLAPWQRLKLIKQAGCFSKEKMMEMHQRLFKIDLESKTGTSPLSLTQNIDFFLLCM